MSVYRIVGYAGTTVAVAAHSLFEQLWPAQAIRVALDRDYDRQVRKAAEAVADRDFYRSRAEFLADFITAEGLAAVEEETEVLEPGDVHGPWCCCETCLSSPASSAAGDSPPPVEPTSLEAPGGGTPHKHTEPNPSIWERITGGPW